MAPDVVEYLRELTLAFTRLAATCPDLATSRELERIAADLMAKVKELEELRR